MARKSKYTPETVKNITQALAMGATYELACGYAGIGASTFYEWLNAKPEFAETVKGAEGKAAVGWLAKIEKAANNGAWQAAAWKLERRYPEQYGRTVSDQRHTFAHRKEAEAIAAEIGKGDDPAIVGQIERDLLIGIEVVRR